MARAYLRRIRHVIVSALGITVLLGTPLLAQADQGKWWKPKEGDRRVEQRDRNGQGPHQGGPAWGGRGGQDGQSWGGRISYRDRRYIGRGSWGGRAMWRGAPVRRDFFMIRDRRYGGGFFRARRIYAAPRFHGRFVYVRPVRYFIGADALIGGVGIHARIVRPHYLYGCNFCDARFDNYDDYAAHVEHCAYRPSRCDISVSNWDDGSDSNWDGPYSTDDGGYPSDDRGQDGAYQNDNLHGQDGGGYDPHVPAQGDNGYGDDNGSDGNGSDDDAYHHE
jgi:hypothetical protein